MDEYSFNEQEKSRYLLSCELFLSKVLGNHTQIKELFYWMDFFVSAAKKMDKAAVCVFKSKFFETCS